MARFGIAHHTGYTLNYYYQPLKLTFHFHPSGCKWRERRRLLTPSFHYNILETFIDTFNEQSLIMCTKINELCHEKTTIEIDVTNLTNYCSLDIICGNAVFCDDFFINKWFNHFINKLSFFNDFISLLFPQRVQWDLKFGRRSRIQHTFTHFTGMSNIKRYFELIS